MKILDFIIYKIKEIKNDESLSLDINTEFSEIDFDSIDYAELVVNIEDNYNLDILNKDIPWHTLNTVKKLFEVVSNEI